MQLALGMAVVVSVVAQSPELPPFAQTHGKTLSSYYRAPDPTLGPKLLREMIKKENVEHPWSLKNDHVVRLISMGLGDIVVGQPKLVREYEAAFAGAVPAGRRVIVRALHNCGDQDTLKFVDAWLMDPANAALREDLEALKKHLSDPKRKPLWDRPALQPGDLDGMWMHFFITGDYAPIARILDVFDQPAAPENEVLRRVAKWSLGSNLQQHTRLVEVIQKHAKDRPEGSKKVINELIVPAPKP